MAWQQRVFLYELSCQHPEFASPAFWSVRFVDSGDPREKLSLTLPPWVLVLLSLGGGDSVKDSMGGDLIATQVSGNFHMAVGQGIMRDGRHVHQYNLEEAEAFNTSHTIHHLFFGESPPGMRANPLDNITRIIDEGETSFPPALVRPRRGVRDDVQ